MSVVVRLFEPKDGVAVRRAVKAVYDEYNLTWDPDEYHADLFDIEAEYMTDSSRFWVGEVDGDVVGCIGIVTFPTLPGEVGETVVHEGFVRVAGTDCELIRLYVHPEGRRTGLGSKLTEVVIEEARARGCRLMELWSDKRFVDAHRLYQRFGATVVGDRICDDPDISPEFGLMLPVR